MLLFFLLHPVAPLFALEIDDAGEDVVVVDEMVEDNSEVVATTEEKNENNKERESVLDTDLRNETEQGDVELDNVEIDESPPEVDVGEIGVSPEIAETIPIVDEETEELVEPIDVIDGGIVVLDTNTGELEVSGSEGEWSVEEDENIENDESENAAENGLGSDNNEMESVLEGQTFSDSYNEDSTTEEFLADAEESTTTATSTPIVVSDTVAHTNAYYQFTKDQCTKLGSGTYQCFDEESLPEADQDVSFRIWSAPDDEGDLEIYVEDKGEIEKLTDNEFDDLAPSYDPISDSFVWQREIDGVNRIIGYDGRREQVLSDVTINSIEPKRSGEYTVWQGWVDDQWDIYLAKNKEVLRLTDSLAQDIAPYIQGPYIVWNTVAETGKTISLYNVETEVFDVIEDEEGGRAENPRLVLVYDAKYENGDIITKGFDPETGSITPLAAQPSPEPIDIPAADQTGETRALIQNKGVSRDDAKEAKQSIENTSNSASSTDDVVGTTTMIASEDMEPLPLTDFDIIVEPFNSTATTTATST